jgi:predicted nucleic-acid-binding Zn-ribbon protein
MTEEIVICPKCKSKMIQGFVPNYFHNNMKITNWCEGIPNKSILGGVDSKSDVNIPIGAFRCQNCGYIELYAKQEFTAK